MYHHQKAEHEKNQKNRVYLILGFIMLGCSLIFAGLAISRTAELRSEQRKFEKLSDKISGYECNITEASNGDPSVFTEMEEASVPEGEPEILPQYIELAQQNPEMFGWVKINDTILDYPVMYTPNNPEKYLRLSFDGKPSIAGTVFLDHRCSKSSDNLILYGHNMKNHIMFGSVLNYKDEAYWEEHPVICFDTLYEKQEYEVMVAFFDKVYRSDDTCFKYYNFIDAEDEAGFTDAVRSFLEKSLYDTGISAQYGDQLLTLSTCDHAENGRFVVVARKAR